MVRLLLSAGPSGASDWVGNQDVCDTAGGITSLWIGRRLVGPFRSDDSPIIRIRRYDTNQPRYVQVIGLKRSAAYQWKPGIRIAASSCSAIRRHGMSECCSVSILSEQPGSIVVHLRHTCSCSRMDVGYIYNIIYVQYNMTTVRWLLWYDDGVCWWLMLCLEPYLDLCSGCYVCKTFHAGGWDVVI